MRHFKAVILMSVLAIILSGCATGGNHFTQVEKAESEGDAVVYFYRPKMFTGSGLNLQLLDNDEKISRISNGQFIRYVTKPGKHSFRTDTLAIDKALNINVEANNVYFLRTGLRQGLWAGTWYLSRVFEEEALTEMQECCKSGTK